MICIFCWVRMFSCARGKSFRFVRFVVSSTRRSFLQRCSSLSWISSNPTSATRSSLWRVPRIAEEVERLLQKPLAPDVTRDFGWTALHTAAWAGNWKCISLLLEARADLGRQDWFGSTPLYLAAERNNLEAVLWLLAAGADERKAANDLSTPLDIAASCCSKGFIIIYIYTIT